jgi:predicted ferric reductase
MGKQCHKHIFQLIYRVTGLVIQKPAKFSFTPGDWVFIKIPQIATFEWHPFTISSAPEQKVIQ